MQATQRTRPAIGIFLVFFMLQVFAHGDVTPHPIDTSGLKPIGADWVQTNPYRGNEKAIAIGAEGYMHNCAGCHGLNAESGGVAPDLLKLAADCVDMSNKAQQDACFADSDDYFKGITLSGKKIAKDATPCRPTAPYLRSNYLLYIAHCLLRNH